MLFIILNMTIHKYKMFESDTEVLISDNELSDHDKRKSPYNKKKISRSVNLKKNKNKNLYFLLCIDWDMTIINKNNMPFPSAKHFITNLSKLWPNMYIVINTLANKKHIEYTMPDFLKLKYDHIVYNIPKKPLNVVRQSIKDMKYLNGFTGLVDDNSDNFSGQYDIFIDASLYHVRDKHQKIVDINYKKIYDMLSKKIKEFLKTKNI